MKTIIAFFLKKTYNLQPTTRTSIVVVVFLFLASTTFAQVQDTTKVNALNEVLVSSVRANANTPVSFSNLTKKELASRNLGQDIPLLLNFMPSVVTTSDAGNGIGYTGIRVRGSDATRVNVTLNGIPYNDSESHSTYWVNLPDFASSVASVQLQRGVGTSTNGAGAFGASLNVLTDSYSEKSYAQIDNSVGSFNTRKNTVKFSTGLLNNQFELAGRLSNIASDGYIDRAESLLKSYFLQAAFVGKTSLIKALVFGGTEKTYQSWYGVDAATLNNTRTFNFAGMYTDANGELRFYDNQTDNYQQDHVQLHWTETFSSKWSSTFALHYTKGKGYYENFNDEAELALYNLVPTGPETFGDVIDQKWLDNDFYGTTFSMKRKSEKTEWLLGGGYNTYFGSHFGKVIWTRVATTSELGDRYYDNLATKKDGNVFVKGQFQLNSKWSAYADLQFRHVYYAAPGISTAAVDDVFAFFNPKVGLTYAVNDQSQWYFSYAKAQREPNRTDYENGNPRPEKLDDFELGWRKQTAKLKWAINGYYMGYQDQLVLTGQLDEVGNPIRANTGKSYRMGIELDASMALGSKFQVQANVTKSKNIIRDGNSWNGKTIAFSPDLISGAQLSYSPTKALKVSWLQKFVSAQFLNNEETTDARLPDYWVNDLNFSYEIKPKAVFSSVVFSGLLANVLDKKYSANGADYGGGAVFFYPQAGAHGFIGVSMLF
jgi:iron complex outermembrane receptor protein